MPNINIDDAYILNETGAQVDKVTGLYFKNENASDTEKAQARANIGAGGSNDNLLDNWYFVGGGSQLGDGVFPINQRGQSSYSGSAHIIDRWELQNAFANLASDSIYFGATTQNVWALMQQVPSRWKSLWGETITVSAIVNDELIQATYTVPQSGAFDMPSTATMGGVFINLYSADGTNMLFRIYTQYTASYHIKAVKLEKGTVSTLANDVPPDFGAELAKCQRRLFRVSPMGTSSRGYAGFGSANSGKNILVFVPTPVTLAAQPTVSFSNCNAYNYVAGGSIAISSISIDSWTQNGVFLSCTPSDASQVAQYQPYVLRVAQGGYLQFSAEPQ